MWIAVQFKEIAKQIALLSVMCMVLLLVASWVYAHIYRDRSINPPYVGWFKYYALGTLLLHVIASSVGELTVEARLNRQCAINLFQLAFFFLVFSRMDRITSTSKRFFLSFSLIVVVMISVFLGYRNPVRIDLLNLMAWIPLVILAIVRLYRIGVVQKARSNPDYWIAVGILVGMGGHLLLFTGYPYHRYISIDKNAMGITEYMVQTTRFSLYCCMYVLFIRGFTRRRQAFMAAS